MYFSRSFLVKVLWTVSNHSAGTKKEKEKRAPSGGQGEAAWDREVARACYRRGMGLDSAVAHGDNQVAFGI